MTRRRFMRGVSTEAALLLIGIPVLLWTLIPIYHMFLFAISPKDAAFSGQLWPAHPTLRNFEIVFGQKHHFLYNFWLQMWNSLAISCATALLTLLIASAAAFAISRLRMKGGRLVMNMALFTYFIPAAFLAVPMYKTMGLYGLLNNDWALILAMVTVASPYAIWILRQASDKLPVELDYLTGGLSWAADYVAELAPDEHSIELKGWVTLTNTSGTSYRNAKLQLVAGTVNRVQQALQEQ